MLGLGKQIMRWLMAAFLLYLLWHAAPAFAQRSCLPHDTAVQRLSQLYGEVSEGLGVGHRGNALYELFIAPDGSWTILVTSLTGMSCIAAGGDGWTIATTREKGAGT